MRATDNRALLPWIFLATSFALGAQPAQETTTELVDRAIQEHVQGRVQSAKNLYLQAVQRLRDEKGDPAQLARLLHNLSLISIAEGHYASARQEAGEAVGIRKELGDSIRESRSLHNLGEALMHLGDHSAAMGHFQRSLQLARQNQDPQREVFALNDVANIHFFQGRYIDAFRNYRNALAIIEKNPGERWSARYRRRTLTALTALYQKLGQYDRALRTSRALLSLPQAESKSVRAGILNTLGTLFRRLGDPVKAIESYRQALDLLDTTVHVDVKSSVLTNLGIAQGFDLKDRHGALQSFQRAFELSEESSNVRKSLQLRLYRAELLLLLDRFEESEADFGKAVEVSRKLGTPEELWRGLAGLGRVSRALHRDAFPYFSSAVEVIDSVRSRILASGLQSSFLHNKRDVYEGLLESYLARKPTVAGAQQWEDDEVNGQILEWVESARSRAFQDRYQLQPVRRAAEEESGKKARLHELRSTLRNAFSRLLTADEATSDELASELSHLEREYLSLEVELEGDDPGAFSRQAVSLEEAQSRLSPTDGLLSLWLGERQLLVQVLTAHSASVISMPWSQDRSQLVQECLDSVGDRSNGSGMRPCEALGNILLEPRLTRLLDRIVHLYVIPDGPLALLPFELLTLPDRKRLLIEDYSLSYLPSISVLGAGHSTGVQQKLPWKPGLMALGDPAVSAGGESLIVEDEWAKLPYSRQEIRNIADLVPGRSRILLGEEAQKRRLLEPGSIRFPILHLSTHATVDFEVPELSRILFSSGAGGSGADYLFLPEILYLDLRGTELVTLAACETSRGTGRRGEAFLDFNRAFLLAGARSTVSSLWKVSDWATAHLMTRFYRRLAEGAGRAEALRQAKLEMLRAGGDVSHPSSWAAFVLTGEAATPISLPWSWPRTLSIAAGVLILGTVSSRWLRARRLGRVVDR